MIGIAGIILFGVYSAFTGYQTDVYPLDLSRGHLEGIGASSDPQTILEHLKAIKGYLPAEGNAVWLFPNETTSFVRIQADLDVMITSVEKISTVPRDSSAFHTGMLDVKERAEIIQENIMDATPYMYVSGSNVLFTTIWIAGILGIFAILKRKKEELKAYDAYEYF